MTYYEIESGAGMTSPEGKPIWPDGVRVVMNSKTAFRFAMNLLNQAFDDDMEWCDIYIAGELKVLEDE
jgi:hypothetical protein